MNVGGRRVAFTSVLMGATLMLLAACLLVSTGGHDAFAEERDRPLNQAFRDTIAEDMAEGRSPVGIIDAMKKADRQAAAVETAAEARL